MAAVLAGGDGALLSGVHAARLLGVSRWKARGPIRVLVPRRHRPVAGLSFSENSRSDSIDCTPAGPVPCVSVERLVLELAGEQTVGQLGYVMYEGEHLGSFEPERMATLLDRDRNVAGRANAVAALEAYRVGSSGTRSNLEDRVVAGLLARGVPMPAIGVPVDVGEPRPIRPDLTWFSGRICVEVDGKPHERARSVRADVSRTRALERAGFRVVRVRWWEIELAFDDALDRIAEAVLAAIP